MEVCVGLLGSLQPVYIPWPLYQKPLPCSGNCGHMDGDFGQQLIQFTCLSSSCSSVVSFWPQQIILMANVTVKSSRFLSMVHKVILLRVLGGPWRKSSLLVHLDQALVCVLGGPKRKSSWPAPGAFPCFPHEEYPPDWFLVFVLGCPWRKSSWPTPGVCPWWSTRKIILTGSALRC